MYLAEAAEGTQVTSSSTTSSALAHASSSKSLSDVAKGVNGKSSTVALGTGMRKGSGKLVTDTTLHRCV